MKCSKLRRLLADGGPAALVGNREAEDHLVGCGECFAVLEAMTEIDALLPELERLDVSDETVEQLLARSELSETSDDCSTAPAGWMAGVREHLPTIVALWSRLEPAKRLGEVFDRARRARLRWGIVAVPAVVLIGIVSILTVRSTMLSSDAGLVSKAPYAVKLVKFKEKPGEPEEPAAIDTIGQSNRESGRGDGFGGEAGADRDDGRATVFVPMKREIKTEVVNEPAPIRAPIPDPAVDGPELGFVLDDNLVLGVPDAPPPPEPKSLAVVVGSESRDRDNGTEEVTDERIEQAMERSFEGEVTVTGSLIPRSDLTRLSPVVVSTETDGRAASVESPKDDEAKRSLLDAGGDKAKRQDGDESDDAVDHRVSVSRVTPEIDPGALAVARRFLAGREEIDDLTFREARGYWANTYVPGDRTLRQLKARLDRTTGVVGSLHEGSRQISQPFDAPDGAALAVYLHADRAGVETRERMLVQVGLKGTERRSGVRPAMNIGLVLDLTGEVTPEAQISIRALLRAFAAAAELGDRFSLTVAGRPGGTVVAPGDLRHGTLTVAMAEFFGDGASGEILSLDQAAAVARGVVCADDDPNAPLGSSAVIVITGRRLDALTGRLADMAHASAVDGVPWSAIGVGAGVDLAELDALVLAGQGNRRLLTSAADAEALVDRELAAVSRVVARAVRLRIRLAPGVQLVDVIGSVRLDEHRAQMVRDAEQSIDQRLSRNLGIQADRGLDEEGIQIVIPSYYADDAHVVLLDVVVPGPGPVVDVTVRYKDLVHMKNGVARAHLEVARAGNTIAGPLELNVLANLVAVEVASRLDGAADAVAAGDIELARTVLTETLDLVRGVASLVDGLAQNPDLAADMEMLAGYRRALETLSVGDPVELGATADSLRYAGRLKILPPPINDDETD